MKFSAFILFALCLSILGLISPPLLYAQETSAGTAISLPISEEDAKDGNIIVSTSKGYGLTTTAYDSNAYGVVAQSPAVFLQDNPDSKPVINTGKAYVLVSSINGNIKKNDFITTSTIAGAGQKATKNGMILGTALEDYTNPDQKATGKILVSVNPHYNASFIDVKTNLIETLKSAADPRVLTQLTTLRYIVAAGVVMIAFGIGFAYFGRVARSGIEAMGRNPLASRTIQLNLVFNLVLMVIIIMAGLGIGYMILVL